MALAMAILLLACRFAPCGGGGGLPRLRWVTQQGVVAVTASTNAAHLQSDLQVFDFTLSDSEMAELTSI